MKNATKLIGILMSVMLLLSIVGCPKKAVKPGEPIPPPPIPEGSIEPTPTPLMPELTLQTIYFDFDKSDIRTADAEILKANAQVLNDNPMVNITIEGYCDPMGTSEYNMALGWRRATSAQSYLAKLGVDKVRLSTISYGEEKLVTENQDEYWKDRRCEFVKK
jgi:peptidoglycan-associated lipoprotein